MINKNYRTLVLNADYLPLTIIGWQRAIVLIMENRVTQLDFYKNDSIKDGHGREYPIPAVVASHKYIRRDYRHAPFCKKNIYIRDVLTCAYCQKQFDTKHLTFDHVIPRSIWKNIRQGTPTCWENIVTCCLWCNRKKGNKTCEQARMFPYKTPVCPPYGEMFLGLAPWKDSVPPEWNPYIKNIPLFKGTHNEQKATIQ